MSTSVTGEVKTGRIVRANRAQLREWLQRFQGAGEVAFAVEDCTNGTMQQNGCRRTRGVTERTSAPTVVVDATTVELLGACGLVEMKNDQSEIGYWVKREARGRGVATRAVLLVTRWGSPTSVSPSSSCWPTFGAWPPIKSPRRRATPVT